jgi:hypothetical protein
LGEGGSKRAEIKEKEVRELESSDEADDPDMRKNGGSASTSKKIKHEVDTFVIDDTSDDEVVLIPTASLFSSNRLGGRSIKTEIKEDVEDV